MAIFNEILSGRYNRALQKLFAIKGSPPVRQLGGEIMPTVSMFYGVENRFPENWTRFAFARAQVATAGIDASQRMRNPANSNTVVVFEKINFASQLFAVPHLGLQTTNNDLPTTFVVSPKKMDPRQGAQSDSVIVTSENSGAGGAGLVPIRMVAIVPPNGTYDFIGTDIQEIALLPGDAVEIDSGVVNQAVVGISWLWRERLLEESERT